MGTFSENFQEIILPVIIVFSVYQFIGFFGNISVLYIYSTRYPKTRFRLLVLVLSVVDFVSCCTTVPMETISTWLWFESPSVVLCKSKNFFVQLTGLSAMYMLFVTGVYKYRQICRPFATQMSQNLIILLCCVGFSMAFLFAVPAVILWDINIHTIYVHNVSEEAFICEVHSSYQNTIYPLLYRGLLSVFTVLLLVTLILYACVAKVTILHVRRLKGPRKPSNLTSFVNPAFVKDGICISPHIDPKCNDTNRSNNDTKMIDGTPEPTNIHPHGDVVLDEYKEYSVTNQFQGAGVTTRTKYAVDNDIVNCNIHGKATAASKAGATTSSAKDPNNIKSKEQPKSIIPSTSGELTKYTAGTSIVNSNDRRETIQTSACGVTIKHTEDTVIVNSKEQGENNVTTESGVTTVYGDDTSIENSKEHNDTGVISKSSSTIEYAVDTSDVKSKETSVTSKSGVTTEYAVDTSDVKLKETSVTSKSGEPDNYKEDSKEVEKATVISKTTFETTELQGGGVTFKATIPIVSSQSSRQLATYIPQQSVSHLTPAQIRKVIIMVIIAGTFSLTFIMALTFGYVFALRDYKDYSSISDIVLMFCCYRFYFINYALNPVVYFALDSCFRKEVMRIIFCSRNK